MRSKVFALLLLLSKLTLASDHLLPLDSRGTDIIPGSDEFMARIFPSDDDEVVGFYVWPSSGASSYLGLVVNYDTKQYSVIFAENRSDFGLAKVREIEASIAKAISGKLSSFVVESTRWPQPGEVRMECLDGVEVVVAAEQRYGRFGCTKEGAKPWVLMDVRKILVDYASQRRNVTMEKVEEILSGL